ncbi:hypothetical protein [Brevundimonas sp. SL130]|uniref:hypothetical protein n=1 Tax=Brevundimonas sp. SL130 TaxID=2995143 RepID=UPI00226CB756|nr:hypothetical protein [Brevundimonas sp. SL130]WAC59426.1 hypothetical protein OU998_14590 [Brevundimonas sp. SL130]
MTICNASKQNDIEADDGSPCSQADFLRDLTSIANKHDLGINEDAELFVMEAEDFSFRYTCNEVGRLERL